MPTIYTPTDPRLQAFADFIGVMQRRRYESEARNAAKEAKERQLWGMAAGAVGGAVGGAALGPALGTTAALGGLQGAGFGLKAGAQFGGGDIAGGAGTLLDAAGQAAQTYQNVQQYGFPATKLDKREISNLAGDLGLTTRQLSSQAKQAGVPLADYAGTLRQQQDAASEQEAWERNMAGQFGVPPAAIREHGVGPFKEMREQERTQRFTEENEARLQAGLEKYAVQNNKELVLDNDVAEQAVRHYNAVMSDPDLTDEQRFNAMDRVQRDLEDPQKKRFTLRDKPGPSPVENAQSMFQAFEPKLAEWSAQGYEGRMSINAQGEPTISITQAQEPETTIQLPGGSKVKSSRVVSDFVEARAALLAVSRDDITSPAVLAGIDKRALDFVIESYATAENLPAKIEEFNRRSQAPSLEQSVTAIGTAMQQSPDVSQWTPEQAAGLKDEARVVAATFEQRLMAGETPAPEEMQILQAALAILEK
ncbi:MAG: hypothetical protein ACYSWU_14530 [Planctomycetota bacterium]|jgi:hypothetical protein